MITIKTWQELNGCWYAIPLHKDYPNMYGVGLSANIAVKRILDKIDKIKTNKVHV